MAVGPNGERRRADTLANALRVARVATREEAEEHVPKTQNGGLARA